jgi:FkbM family methyltransferase
LVCKAGLIVIWVPESLQRLPVVGRWFVSLARAYARHALHRFCVTKREGLLLLVDQRNSVDRNLLIKGRWEGRQLDRLVALARDASASGKPLIFCDIGSHGGLYAMVMHNTGLFSRIVAFEPDPVNVVQLRANLFINGLLDQIEVVEVAASDRSGDIDFFVAIDSNRGGSRMGEAGEAPLSRKVTVKAMPSDDVIQASGMTAIIKIDVETYEMQVLAGLERTLAENDCILQIEIFADNVETVARHMASLGYERFETITHDHYFRRSTTAPAAPSASLPSA